MEWLLPTVSYVFLSAIILHGQEVHILGPDHGLVVVASLEDALSLGHGLILEARILGIVHPYATLTGDEAN
jgi:hypothetical protein